MTTIAEGALIPTDQINQWCPVGMVTEFAGAVAPDGWLVCDGASYLRSAYPELYAEIGVTYGSADGTHFNVPDCRDRVTVGVGINTALAANDGVAAANRHGTRHRHTPHLHGGIPALSSTDNGGAGAGNVSGTTNSATADGGSGVSADPLDGPASIGLNKIIRAKDA